MDSSTGHEVKYQNPRSSSVVTQTQKISESPSLPTVTFQEVLVTVNNLVFAQKNRYLSDAEIIILKGTWDSQDFREIATEQTKYAANYLQRRVAPQLWNLLSETIADGEPVYKRKVRNLLEQVTKKHHTQYSQDSAISSSDSKFVHSIKGQLPQLPKFYGREEELSQLKILVNQHRCICLTGVPGVGKSTLSAKLLSELSLESPQKFDFLIWKSVTHTASVQDLVSNLVELIQPLEPSTILPDYTQAIITVLIKYLHSHRCLLVLDGFESLFKTSNLEQRLEYRILMRRLLEEEHRSSLILTCRVLPDELDNLSKHTQAIKTFRVEGFSTDAAMQYLTDQGLTDEENCLDIIKTYYGNISELQMVVQRIKYFFAGSTEKFYQHKTTFISDEFQKMLNEAFSDLLDQFELYLMIFIAEKIASGIHSLSFSDLLMQVDYKKNTSISTSSIIKALEKLERLSLIESIKDPNTMEISFTLQPVVRKYINKDPLGIIYKSNAFSHLANAS
ncbi:MAG: NACHT domain-containing protein [Nostoc sp. TH1S01]|nr:NACHT domain-containing protein [Nostoc sp. TH1S01]